MKTLEEALKNDTLYQSQKYHGKKVKNFIEKWENDRIYFIIEFEDGSKFGISPTENGESFDHYIDYD